MIIQCRFCELAGTYRLATKLAPQDEGLVDPRFWQGTRYMLRWLPVCDTHFERWFTIEDGAKSPPYFDMDQGKLPAHVTKSPDL